jgi:hypothetical protein
MSPIPIILEKEELLTPDDFINKKKTNLIPNASQKDGIFNFNGFKVPISGGTNAVLFNHFASRRNHNQPNIIAVTGNPGSGKTLGSIRLSQIYDSNFKILRTDEEDSPTSSNVVFSREHLKFLIDNDSPLKRGACICIDEANLVVGSRHWLESIQRDIVEKLEAIRSRGYMLFIIVLHRSMLDSQMRNFTLSHQLHLERPGVATLYQLNNNRFSSGEVHQRRLGQFRLLIPFWEQCQHNDCLNCEFLFPKDKNKECNIERAIYERNKRDFIGHYKSEKNKLPKKKELPSTFELPFGKTPKEMPSVDTTPEKTEFDELAQKLFEHQEAIVWDSSTGVVSMDSAVSVLWKFYGIHRKRGDIAKAVTIFKRMLKK